MLLLPGYHVPEASIHLLSSQSLFVQLGMSLAIWPTASHCLLIMTSSLRLLMFVWISWLLSYLGPPISVASGSTASSSPLLELLLGANHYLPRAPKELLLWHQHLSHASLMTIHNLVYQTCWGSTPSSEDLIPPDQGDLLSCTYYVHYAVCENLLCVAGENATATCRCSPVEGAFSGCTHRLERQPPSHWRLHLLWKQCPPWPQLSCVLFRLHLHLTYVWWRHHFCLSRQWLNLPPRCSLNASETIHVKF